MWIFTTRGMLSIVEHREDQNLLCVRARRREHLTELFPLREFQHTPYADYHWRMVIPREEVAKTLVKEVYGIKYPNFKDASDPSLTTTYSRVWGDCLAMQGPVPVNLDADYDRE